MISKHNQSVYITKEKGLHFLKRIDYFCFRAFCFLFYFMFLTFLFIYQFCFNLSVYHLVLAFLFSKWFHLRQKMKNKERKWFCNVIVYWKWYLLIRMVPIQYTKEMDEKRWLKCIPQFSRWEKITPQSQ